MYLISTLSSSPSGLCVFLGLAVPSCTNRSGSDGDFSFGLVRYGRGSTQKAFTIVAPSYLPSPFLLLPFCSVSALGFSLLCESAVFANVSNIDLGHLSYLPGFEQIRLLPNGENVLTTHLNPIGKRSRDHLNPYHCVTRPNRRTM